MTWRVAFLTALPGFLKHERVGAANPAVVGHFGGMIDRIGRLPYEIRGTRRAITFSFP
jgi:hypothetical protein